MRHQLFGEFLIDEGFVTLDQLNEALSLQRSFRRTPLGEILVEMGLMTRIELLAHLSAHLDSLNREDSTNLRFGEYLVEEGIVRRIDIERAIWHQRKRRSRRIGELLVTLGYLEPEELESAVVRQLRLLATA